MGVHLLKTVQQFKILEETKVVFMDVIGLMQVGVGFALEQVQVGP